MSLLQPDRDALLLGVNGLYVTMKLLVDGFSTKITRVRQELRVLVYPSSIESVQQHPAASDGAARSRQREIGTRRRRLPAGRQALLALARLRCGDTYAQLAAGFGIGIATVYRYIREAIEVLARSRTDPG